MRVKDLTPFQLLLYVEKQKGFAWTCRRMAKGTNIPFYRVRAIRSNFQQPTFAEALALLNLIKGDLDRPSVRSVWKKLRDDKKN